MSVQIAVPVVCLVVSLLVALASFVVSLRCCPPARPAAPEEDESARSFALHTLAASTIAIVLLFALSRRTTAPFSSGQGLGNGLLIGGVLALLGTAMRLSLLRRWSRGLDDAARDGQSAALHALYLAGKWSVGELAVAIAPVAFVMWRVQDDPTDALIGCAIGTLIVRFFVGFAGHGLSQGTLPAAGLTDEAVGLFHVALVVASTLAVLREADAGLVRASLSQRHLLWMLPLLAATIITVVSMFALRFLKTGGIENPAIGIALVAVAAAVLNIGAFAWLTLYVYRARHLFVPLALGAGAGLFLVALILSAQPASSRNGALGLVAGLLLLALWSECFRRLAGYGVALASVGALSLSGLVVALTLAAETLSTVNHPLAVAWGSLAQRVTVAIGLLVSVSLARIFLTVMHLRPTEMSVFSNYLLMGLALGLLTPLLLLDARTTTPSSAPSATGEPLARSRITREVLGAGMIGLMLFLLVVVAPLFFRVRASAGLTVGLVIAQAVLMFIAFSGQFVSQGPPRRWCLPPLTLFTIGGGLLCAQLATDLAGYTGVMERVHKLVFTAALLLVAFAWFVLAGRVSSSSEGDQQ